MRLDIAGAAARMHAAEPPCQDGTCAFRPSGASVSSCLSPAVLRVRPVRSALLVALAVALAGCFTLRSTIAVRPDGSGTLTEALALSGPALAMMGDGEAPLSTPAALRSRAARLGEGVTVVRSDTAGGVRTTVYAFPSVAGLRYTLPDNASESADVAQVAGAPPLVTFAFDPAATSGTATSGAATLHIIIPEPPAGNAPVPDSAAVAGAVQRLPLVRVLLGGARATVEVVAEGEAVEGERATTLLDLSFDALLDLVARNPELGTRAAPPLDEIRRLADGRAGLTVRAPGTTTVRFR